MGIGTRKEDLQEILDFQRKHPNILDRQITDSKGREFHYLKSEVGGWFTYFYNNKYNTHTLSACNTLKQLQSEVGKISDECMENMTQEYWTDKKYFGDNK